jgi:hypothetical protein
MFVVAMQKGFVAGRDRRPAGAPAAQVGSPQVRLHKPVEVIVLATLEIEFWAPFC